MAKYIQVNARYDRMHDNGIIKKVTEPYLVDALSCTEAEARVTEEIAPYISGEFSILSVTTTRIAEAALNGNGDRYYKVKINFITLDEKTAMEKRVASFILVQASTFHEAFKNFEQFMKDSVADFEIESISETKIVDVFEHNGQD